MSSHVRLATPGDAAEIAAIYAPFVRDTPISFETVPPTAEEMAERIQKTLETYPWLVLEDEGQIRGYAYAGAYRARAAYIWSVDVAIYVHPDAKRSGVGRRLYNALFDILRAQGFVNAHAGITLPNPGSVGLHERLGFVPVGIYPSIGYKAGAWHDTGWWRLTLTEPPLDPPQPVPLSHFEGVDAILAS
ncbi:N-acetyltransferase family protein [bacterium]|nr:MAG: N-acetyltransferase family protein [bacterium]